MNIQTANDEANTLKDKIEGGDKSETTAQKFLVALEGSLTVETIKDQLDKIAATVNRDGYKTEYGEQYLALLEHFICDFPNDFFAWLQSFSTSTKMTKEKAA